MREVVAEAWARSPRQVVAAVLLAPVVVLACWALLVGVLVAWGPS